MTLGCLEPYAAIGIGLIVGIPLLFIGLAVAEKWRS